MGYDNAIAYSRRQGGSEPAGIQDAGSAGGAAAAASYIAALSGELARLARRHGLGCLGYILDMAQLEADQTARSVTGAEAGD